MRLPLPPTFDALERRVLLSAAAATSGIALQPSAATVAPFKKGNDGGEEDNDDDKKDKAPEITVLFNGVSIADNSGNIDFGSVTRGAGGPTRTFVIRDDGNKGLSVGSISLPAGFSLLDTPAGKIDDEESTSFTVRLDTATAGSRSGQITFSTNDADENPFNFTIRGVVNAPPAVPAPELTVLINGRGVGSFAGLDFGTVAPGAFARRTVTIRNDGKAPLNVFKIRMTEGFTLADAPGVSLAPGESDTMTIKFTGTIAGAKTGVLTFRSNDADERGFALKLSGTISGPPATPTAVEEAKASVWLVRPGRRSLEIADGAAAAVSFGTVARGATAPTRTFRVVNIGDATMTLGALQLPAGFSVVEGLKTSLAPGQLDEFTVRMNTSTVGSPQGQIRFTTNDPGASVFNFPVAGDVTPPPVTTPTADLGGGTLTVNGTSGGDTIVVSGKSALITVTINGTPMTGSPFANVAKVVVNAGAGNDTVLLGKLFINVTANGGPGSDTLVGSIGNDVLNGEGGNDSLDGAGGDDFLLGGDGDDTLTGGDGVDAFHGEAGDDTLNALDGISDTVLDSGEGTDVVHRDRVDPMSA